MMSDRLEYLLAVGGADEQATRDDVGALLRHVEERRRAGRETHTIIRSLIATAEILAQRVETGRGARGATN